ncbi:MAG: hydantoinase B/oxoprolinase family protein, partial [Alicyclobacillus sp.]|nr:hydantoinase B/oxoprolinase family protein [Alicyclobacillus sp.]
SSVIRESHDASCALLDASGRVLAQHVVLPLHLGAFTECTKAVIARYEKEGFEEGDGFFINHPYHGGSPHAPDLAVITPIFAQGRHIGFAATMAHKNDIGGPVPGSCPTTARDVFAEGIQLPPVRFVRAGQVVQEVVDILRANTRTPDLVWGDVRGQLGACRLGERLVQELAGDQPEVLLQRAHANAELTRQRVLKTIASWPDGVYRAVRYVDHDGMDTKTPLRLSVQVIKEADRLTFDLTDCHPQTVGPANIRPPLARAAAAFVLTCLIDPNLSINYGLLESFALRTRPGTIVDPRYPAPVNTYNPTVHALEEALFAALSPLAERRVAGGAGSRSLAVSGRHPQTGEPFVMYELFGGGSGARVDRDGVNGTTVNHTNAHIAPIEIIESEYPVRLVKFELIPDSGGPGRQRGGLGFRREYEILADEVRVNVRSDKHIVAPLGLDGGWPGRPGRLVVQRQGGAEEVLGSRVSDLILRRGDHIALEVPGGGGVGNPEERDPALLERDRRFGYVRHWPLPGETAPLTLGSSE